MLKTARLAVALCAATLSVTAPAQTNWPTRAVTIIVPFTPGGGTDIGT
ncbi:MAG TPA: LacI family transcriptional regulator, partial [Cupriavidus sp.]|nr:LacI family transcriptional regulator [Cupriavidus sp.]